MTDVNTGGPAFPNPALADPNCNFQVDVSGMTLRDWFAGQALAGCTTRPDLDSSPTEDIAEFAYLQADAMLRARV